jgi:hypothetical protein
MMFSTTLTSAAVLLSLALHVSAHVMALPALGVTGSPVRNDAQRLSTAKPCGNTDIASNLDKATASSAAPASCSLASAVLESD